MALGSRGTQSYYGLWLSACPLEKERVRLDSCGIEPLLAGGQETIFQQFWALSVSLSAVGVLKGHHGCMDIALWNSRCELTLIQLAWNKQMAGLGCPTLMSFSLFKYTEQRFNPFSSLECYKNKHCSISASSMWRVRLDMCLSVNMVHCDFTAETIQHRTEYGNGPPLKGSWIEKLHFPFDM